MALLKHTGLFSAPYRTFQTMKGTGLCLNNTVQKDSRGVLGTTFLSENSRQIYPIWIQYGGLSIQSRHKEAEKEGLYCALHPTHV